MTNIEKYFINARSRSEFFYGLLRDYRGMHWFVKGGVTRNIIIFIFIVLTFLCSCSEKNKSESDLLNKEKALSDDGKYTDSEKNKTAPDILDNERALWNGKKYTDPKKAIEYLNNDIKLLQKNAVKYNNRGTAYYGLGKYQLAIEDCNKAIKLKKDFVDAYANRGLIYLNLGNKELGCQDLKKACELGMCGVLEKAKNKGSCPLI